MGSMTKIKHFSKVELDLASVKDAVISSLETQFPGQKVTSILPLYSSPVGYYEDRFPSQRDFSGFDVTLEPEG
jgi:hypothetical protein